MKDGEHSNRTVVDLHRAYIAARVGNLDEAVGILRAVQAEVTTWRNEIAARVVDPALTEPDKP